MNAELIERAIAAFGSILVGGTALYQLRNELASRGLDASATKVLLGLLVAGCIMVFFAAINVLGNFAA